jgi:hypothetical protein
MFSHIWVRIFINIFISKLFIYYSWPQTLIYGVRLDLLDLSPLSQRGAFAPIGVSLPLLATIMPFKLLPVTVRLAVPANIRFRMPIGDGEVLTAELSIVGPAVNCTWAGNNWLRVEVWIPPVMIALTATLDATWPLTSRAATIEAH